jgi:phage-related protein (TIGR01555 family)
MLNWFRKLAGGDALADEPPKTVTAPEAPIVGGGVFSTGYLDSPRNRASMVAKVEKAVIQQRGTGMDAAEDLKAAYSLSSANITDAQFAFYGSQSFIGYQTMAMIAQHWLVNKACSQPGKDAIRNGYEITANDGKEVTPETLAKLAKADRRFKVKRNLLEFVYFGRMFGIRHVLFEVDSSDPDYYVKPFNPDGVTLGTYRGMVQIDPYWITPELGAEAATNPQSPHFYEPTFWLIKGKRFHRSHFVIFKGPNVADYLKPTYRYGGLSVPQMIFERVYGAERTANEAPMLAQSKRETVLHIDVDKAIANQEAFETKIGTWTQWRNNFGVKIVGPAEVVQQFETSLADLDDVIMTQYQLVASIAGVPVTKLLGTVPKGFNSTGEYDEASYHEELESLQEHDLDPLLERHHLLVMRSEIPKENWFSVEAKWNTLDAMTAEEQANVNKTKAETAKTYFDMGAIDGIDERARLIADPESGYSGLTEAELEDPLELDDDETDSTN